MKKALVAVLMVVLAGVGVWCVTRGPQEPEPPGPDGGQTGGKPAPLTDEEARRLIELKNTGVGYLENHKLADAVAAFDQLTRELPEEAAGWRNLAIARVFRIEKGLNPQSDEPQLSDPETAFAEAHATLDQLAQRDPDSAVLHFLRGKLASLQQDPDTATREYLAAGRKAAQGDEFAGLAAGIFHTANQASAPYQSSDETKQLGRDALRLAHEAAPDNLFLSIFWVVEQAQAEDPTIADTLAAIRPDVEYVTRMGKATEDTPLDHWHRATEALAAGDWAGVHINCRRMTNLCIAVEPAQSDRDYQANVHVLDFAATDLSPSFYERISPPAWPDDGVPVAFSHFPRQLPAGEGAILDARLADMDVDGRLDACILRTGRLDVWRAADGGGWELLTSSDVPEGYTGLLVCELDDDAQNTPHAPQPAAPTSAGGAAHGTENGPSGCRAADPDVVLYGEARVLILENEWDKPTGRRSLVPPSGPEPRPGEEPFTGPLWPEATGVSLVDAADLNLDGDLDLLLFTKSGPRLWSNRNSFLFQDMSDRIRFPEGSEHVVAAFPVDWDRDTDIDVLLAMSDGTVGVLECLRHLTFRWRPLGGINVGRASSLAVVELDGNVSWDVLVGGPDRIHAAFTRTPVTGRVVVDKTVPVADLSAAGLGYWDYDNDGRMDVVAWDRERVRVARGLPGGGYQAQEDLLAGTQFPAPLLRCESGDLDGDGDIDLLIAGESGVLLCSNDGGDANGWLDMTLAAMFSLEKTGTQTRRTNHYGVGSTLELKSGAHYQAQVVRGQSTHFGLGKLARADVARVTWTNGFPENTMRPEQRQNVCQVETPKGSCPFLYTWNGERFVFATDLCWAAPLGMQTAQGGMMPGRNWEYLLIPGELLAPRDGRYVLQCTGELWEAEYFDQVELMAVDHPDTVEVYSNEKVGPPEITEFQIHTAHTRHSPRAARTQTGRDLLPEISHRDGVFARPFEKKRMQGYTDDSHLELDLGPLADPANVKLFLTGWMFPTDTSMNVALAENPVLPGPQAPSLWVPDKTGAWQQVIPYMGFPGGKTKTIVFDLSGKFLSGDHRLQIATSMEIYWDEIFFTSGEEPGEYSLTPLTAVAADLHDRGFSRRIPQPHHAPPVFDYDDVRTEAAWAPMKGYFTRFGDVTELVTAADDRMVILFGGDEMTVEFPALPAPPPGWKRDFILHNVGWDKDADLNTVLGQTVEPLPFAAMSSYPYPATEHYPDTPLHQEYLQKYQTRTIDDAPFRRLIHAWQPGTELVSP